MRSGNLKEMIADENGKLRPSTDDDFKRAPAGEGQEADPDESNPALRLDESGNGAHQGTEPQGSLTASEEAPEPVKAEAKAKEKPDAKG